MRKMKIQLSRIGTPQLLNLSDGCRVRLFQYEHKGTLTGKERTDVRQTERLQREIADLFSQLVYFK